ncbi:O-antigen ligase family protein [Luteococcus sp.]|uniref:O-antigen ligase family protein n=1 Tax=Luteococcus sp. TaxID=1969402 RepID=UPI003736D135
MESEHGASTHRRLYVRLGQGMLWGSALIMLVTALIEPPTTGPELGGPSELSSVATRLFQLIALGCAALVMMRGTDGHRGPYWVETQLVFGALLVWSFTRLLADLQAGQRHVSLYMAIFVILGFALVVYAHGVTIDMLRWPLRIYTVLSFVLAFMWPDQVLCVIPGDERELFGMTRLCGVTGQPNTLGEIAGISLLLEVCSRTKRDKAKRIIFSLFATGSLLLSQSRTSWMACLLALGVLWVWWRGRTKPGSVSVIAVAFTALLSWVYLAMPPLQRMLLGAGGDEGLGTVNGRDQIWAAAMAEFSRDPMFGYGLDLYDAEFTAKHLPYGLQMVRDSHSQFVQTLGESGLIGMFGLLVFILACLSVAVRRWRADSPLPFALLTFMLLRSVTESGLMFLGVGWQLWCVLTMTATMVVSTNTDAPADGQSFAYLLRGGRPRSPHLEVGSADHVRSK